MQIEFICNVDNGQWATYEYSKYFFVICIMEVFVL